MPGHRGREWLYSSRSSAVGLPADCLMRLPSPTSWGLPNPASAASPAARLLYDRGLLAHHCGMAPFGTRYGAYDGHPSQGGGLGQRTGTSTITRLPWNLQ